MKQTIHQIDQVRNASGWFRRSDRSFFAITGADRYTWLQGMVTADVRELENSPNGALLQACMLDPTGHVLSDLELIQLDADSAHELLPAAQGEGCLLVSLPAENLTRILELLDRYLITEDVELFPAASIHAIAVQGPEAEQDIALAFSDSLPEEWLFSRVDLSGSGGGQILVSEDAEPDIINLFVEHQLPELDPETVELLRIEAGIPRWSRELNDTILAPEAGLLDTHISLRKGCYIGQEIVARIESRGHTNRTLTGFVVVSGNLPAEGEKLISSLPDENGKTVGWITSVAAESPACKGAAIALGYLRHEQRTPGAQIIAETGAILQVTALPFYRRTQR